MKRSTRSVVRSWPPFSERKIPFQVVKSLIWSYICHITLCRGMFREKGPEIEIRKWKDYSILWPKTFFRTYRYIRKIKSRKNTLSKTWADLHGSTLLTSKMARSQQLFSLQGFIVKFFSFSLSHDLYGYQYYLARQYWLIDSISFCTSPLALIYT